MKKSKKASSIAFLLSAFLTVSALCGCKQNDSIKFKNVSVVDGGGSVMKPRDGSRVKLLDNYADAAEELELMDITDITVDEEYFDTYKLLAIVLPSTPAHQYKIKDMTLDGDTLKVCLTVSSPKAVNALLVYKTIFADIPKDAVPDGVKVSIVDTEGNYFKSW